MKRKYSDKFIDDLVRLGYTHCFFVGGGNVMHVLESARTRMVCVAVVNEVSAGIAAEYFNVASRDLGGRAFALVTAGPGLTNLITAISAAWLESRELLVVGGQARTDFLSKGTVRQIGHQEIDGVSITKSITKKAMTVEQPLTFEELRDVTNLSRSGRKGPVFLELCLDVTATFVEDEEDNAVETAAPNGSQVFEFDDLVEKIGKAQRPMFLVGQGLGFKYFQAQLNSLRELGIPVSTTWNAADYLSYDDHLYAGRPNTYGMRWANAVIQQADLVVSLGARLGLQQTGFNWEEFVPVGEVVHFDIDPEELSKNNPETVNTFQCDVNDAFPVLVESLRSSKRHDYSEWREFIQLVKKSLPINESANRLFSSYVNPFDFMYELSELLSQDAVVIPCSSGGAYTTVMQGFKQKVGQLLTNNKGLASMGYGLAGAIGSAFASPGRAVYLLEGDGGFAQNLSELGTLANQKLNIKLIIFDNGGYASIRVSQKAYFDGNYIGCDEETGVGLPDWNKLFGAYGIPCAELSGPLGESSQALDLLSRPGPGALILHVNKDQPFLPKVTSKIFSDGSMKSNPIHLMTPPLDMETEEKVFHYLPPELRTH
jgi:acetolactate synthase I/II/III large subunit